MLHIFVVILMSNIIVPAAAPGTRSTCPLDVIDLQVPFMRISMAFNMAPRFVLAVPINLAFIGNTTFAG
jgi:hypothetical protein